MYCVCQSCPCRVRLLAEEELSPAQLSFAKLEFACMLQIKVLRNPKYIPDFGKAFEHFLIHTGGKAILDGLQKKLSLSDKQVKAGPSYLVFLGPPWLVLCCTQVVS